MTISIRIIAQIIIQISKNIFNTPKVLSFSPTFAYYDTIADCLIEQNFLIDSFLPTVSKNNTCPVFFEIPLLIVRVAKTHNKRAGNAEGNRRFFGIGKAIVKKPMDGGLPRQKCRVL